MTTPTAEKTVLITGGATGLGYAIAELFLNDGANVVLNGRTASKLVEAARQLGQSDRVAVVAGDVTEPKTSDACVACAVERFGRLNVLVNNAGIFRSKPFTDYAVAELDEYLGYLRGAFLLSQAVVRQMRNQGGGGAIINITTVLALNGVAGFPASAPIAAKGGLNALTQNLAVELAAENIRINAVAPGVVPTPLHGELNKEQLKSLEGLQPLGRYGTPKDIADAVLYLANATWVTGVVLPVDGGVTAGGDGTAHLKPTASGAGNVG
jgi:NAD(P)-dependent dehydrogenase (short-subunit alcohol dehydrogenase family)